MMARNKNITAVSQHKRRIQLLVGQLALRHRHLQVARVPLPLRVLLPPQVLLLHLDRLLPHTQEQPTQDPLPLATPEPAPIQDLLVSPRPTPAQAATLGLHSLPAVLATLDHSPASPSLAAVFLLTSPPPLDFLTQVVATVDTAAVATAATAAADLAATAVTVVTAAVATAATAVVDLAATAVVQAMTTLGTLLSHKSCP